MRDEEESSTSLHSRAAQDGASTDQPVRNNSQTEAGILEGRSPQSLSHPRAARDDSNTTSTDQARSSPNLDNTAAAPPLRENSTSPSAPTATSEAGEQQTEESSAPNVGRSDNSSSSSSSPSEESTGSTFGDTVVLTPSRLRMDSRVVLGNSITQWAVNAIFAGLILFKDTMIYHQLGPPPPTTATVGLHLQYNTLKRTRSRSHLIDAANNAIEGIAMLVVKLVFCWMLESNQLYDIPFRVLFVPFWVAWVITNVISCFKDRSERMLGSARDLLYIFMLCVAFKMVSISGYSWQLALIAPWICFFMDSISGYSWRLAFIVPWMWFCVLFLLAGLVAMLLLFARIWTRLLELLLPLGFFCLLASTAPQFASYLLLVQRLDGDKSISNALLPTAPNCSQLLLTAPSCYQLLPVTNRIAVACGAVTIIIPNIVSWLLMWFSAMILAAGLYRKERVRAVLLANGAVWTAHETVARRLYEDRAAAQAEVANLSEEQITQMVNEMMAGKEKPSRLVRVGNTLYRRITDDTVIDKEAKPHSVRETAGLVTVEEEDLGPSGGEVVDPTLEGRTLAGALNGVVQVLPGQVRGTRPETPPVSFPTGQLAPPGAESISPPRGSTLQRPASSSPQLLASPGTALVVNASFNLAQRTSSPLAASPSSRRRPTSQPSVGVSGGEDATNRANSPSARDTGSTLPRELGRTQVYGSRGSAGSRLSPQGAPSRPTSASLLERTASPPMHELSTSSSVAARNSSATNTPRPGLDARELSSQLSSRRRRARSTSITGSTASRSLTAARMGAAATLLLGGIQESMGGGAGAGSPMSHSSNQVAPEPSQDPHHELRQQSKSGPRPDSLSSMLNQGLGISQQAPAPAPADELGDDQGLGISQQAPAPADELGDDQCVICYDEVATCVFLDCCHGGFCRRCAYILCIRPPNECPTCRARIDQVVELETVAQIGETSRVKG
eukprot:gene23179-30391_t